METMAERLKWLRKEKCHKTLEEVGKHVGVGKSAIQKYENGIVTQIPPDKIVLLAEALETTPDFIMGVGTDPEYEKVDSRFGKVLKEEREREGMSIREFAKYLGISERMLAKYERGEIIPTWDTAFRITAPLGISLAEYDPTYIGIEERKESDKLNDEIVSLLGNLPKEKRRQILDYIRFLALQELDE